MSAGYSVSSDGIPEAHQARIHTESHTWLMIINRSVPHMTGRAAWSGPRAGLQGCE